MRHEELEELIPVYALGALDGEALQALEAHLHEGCARCERLLLEFSSVAASLAESLPDVTVPPHLRHRVLERIEREHRVEPPSEPFWRRASMLRWGAAIAAAAAVSMLLWNTLTLRDALRRERAARIEAQQEMAQEAQRLREQLARREAEMTRLQAQLVEQQTLRAEGIAAARRQRERAEAALAQLRLQFAEQQRRATDDASAFRARLAQQETETSRLQKRLQEQEREAAETVRSLRDRLQQETAELANLQGRLARQEAIIRVIEDPQSRVVALGGLEPAPQASGKVIWQPVQHTALFYAYRLPPLPSGKTYQLWTITDRPISSGVFEVDRSGNAAMRLTTVPGQVKTFAVTIEPTGGLPQPTGAIYLAGSL